MPRIRRTPELAVFDERVTVLDEPVLDETAVPAEPPPPIRTAEPTPPPVAVGPIPESVSRHAEDIRTGDRLLTLQQDGQRLDPNAQTFLGWLWPDKSELARQASRVARRCKLQRRAATAPERDAARAAAEATAKQLQSEGDRLREIIAQAQADLDTLQRDADQARAVVEGHDAALAGLTDPTLLNDCDRAMYERKRTDWEAQFGRPSRELRGQAEAARRLAALDPERDQDQIGTYAQSRPELNGLVTLKIQTVAPEMRTQDIRDKRFFFVNLAAWTAHVEQLKQQAAEADREAARLEQDGQALKAELQAMLDTLIPS